MHAWTIKCMNRWWDNMIVLKGKAGNKGLNIVWFHLYEMPRRDEPGDLGWRDGSVAKSVCWTTVRNRVQIQAPIQQAITPILKWR